MGESDGFSWLSPKAARKQLELIYNEAKAFNKGKSETYTKNYQAADAAFIKVDGYFEKLLLNSDTIAVYENSGLNTLATDYNLKTVSAEEMDKFKVISMNRVAEALTGWTLLKAEGHPIEEVLRIIDVRTRETVENPVKRA